MALVQQEADLSMSGSIGQELEPLSTLPSHTAARRADRFERGDATTASACPVRVIFPSSVGSTLW